MDLNRSLALANALLSAVAVASMTGAWVAAKRKKFRRHRNLMLVAFGASALFLACFVLRFVRFGFAKFTHEGPLHWLYSVVFWTHEPLAVVNVPLAMIALGLGLLKSHPAHKEVAKIALPIWLYVACTGVMLYVLLYVVPPVAAG